MPKSPEPSGFLPLDRRHVLLGLGAGLCLPAPFVRAAPVGGHAFREDPFALGVASGDPDRSGFVIWTRLAPKPLEPGGGMPGNPVELSWIVASDPEARIILRQGQAVARPEQAHTVHVEVDGLQPGREYFYRFESGGLRSPVGRARTVPEPGQEGTIRFVSAGCQRYEDGYFTAWRHIAARNPDFIVHYGDYIYEYKALRKGADRRVPVVREMPDLPGKCLTLADYRHRYALYKLDADLQAAHRAAPFLASFDDHEVENNWAGYASEIEGVTRAAFAQRRAAAFKAWYEHMPVRRAQRPNGPDILAYRRLRFGDLLQVDILDTRQYRDPQPCGDGWKTCPEAREARRTMLGRQQEAWLEAGWRGPPARWNLLAQQVPMMRFDRDPDPALVETHMDKWDGAEAARQRLFDAAGAARLGNLVVLSGDVHHNRAAELCRDFDDPASARIGVEFVATSISSAGDGEDRPATTPKLLAANPHLKFFNSQRGYVLHEVDARRWQAEYRVLDSVSRPDRPDILRQRCVVEAGRPVLHMA
ncbi:MAG: alkaline phosphatase D family protein [Beijerinckiaceae bacterium]|nr:alkaline phosphatase D family protein [Beijerinckiaceae bacterium]